MAETYVRYDPSRPNAATLARAVDYLSRGREELNRFYQAATTATNGGSDTAELVGGDFGALDADNAALMWTQMWTIKNLLDQDDAGGLALALGSLDKGISG